MSRMPRASVVIPTWNGAELLGKALAALERQTLVDFEIVIVDNGSTDGTRERVRAQHPDAVYLRFDENRGFAAAANAGIRAARGAVIALLNNDTEPEAAWLAALVTVLNDDPEVGACASKMLMFSDPNRIDSAGDRWRWFAYPIGHGELDGPPYDRPREVFSACAGAAAYRRAALEDAGLFDEHFFAFLEDVDLGIRLRLAGWRCRYVPDAIVRHHGSATARRLPRMKLHLLMRNSLILFFQYSPIGTMALGAPFMLAWPFYRVARERQAPTLAFRVLLDLARHAAAIVRRRREVRSRRTGAVRRWASAFARPGERAVDAGVTGESGRARNGRER